MHVANLEAGRGAEAFRSSASAPSGATSTVARIDRADREITIVSAPQVTTIFASGTLPEILNDPAMIPMNEIVSHLRPMRVLKAAFLAAALTCCLVSDLDAAVTNYVGANIDYLYGPPSGRISFGEFTHTQNSFTSDRIDYGFTNSDFSRGGQVEARASGGSVGVIAVANYTAFRQFGNSGDRYNAMAAVGLASSSVDDVRITGPGSGNVSTRLRLHLEGNIGASSFMTNIEPNGVVGAASISLVIYLNGNFLAGGNFERQSINSENFVYPSGMLATFDGDDVLTTGSFSVPLNTPFTLKLEITVRASAEVQETTAGGATGSGTFYNTLTFATDRPVFELPAGYTANSSSAGIVNNSFTAVPEPAAATLLLLAAPAFLLRRHR